MVFIMGQPGDSDGIKECGEWASIAHGGEISQASG